MATAAPARRLDRVERRRRGRRCRCARRMGSGGARDGAVLGRGAGRGGRHRPGGVGSRAAPRAGRLRDHDAGRLRVRFGSEDGHRVHRRTHHSLATRRRGSARPVDGCGQPAGHRRGRRARPGRGAALAPAAAHRRGAASAGHRRSPRPRHTRGRCPHPDQPDRQLRRARRGPLARRCRRAARTAGRVGRQPGHGAGHHRRTAGRHRGQPTADAGRDPRHRRVAEGRTLRGVLRRVQPAPADAGRHPGLLARQGPRVARHDPPRGAARLRLCPRNRPAGVPDAAQVLRGARTSSWTRRRWATTSRWPGRRPRSR